MRADDGRWDSKFGQFVSRIGASSLAEQVGVDRSCVYQWLRGDTSPRTEFAIEIRRVAQSNGFSISLDDVYENFSPRRGEEWARARRRKP